MTAINDVAETLDDLAEAVDGFARTLRTSGLVTDPTGLGNHLACYEAEAFASLFDALDLGDLATALREQHYNSDDDDEKESHVQ